MKKSSQDNYSSCLEDLTIRLIDLRDTIVPHNNLVAIWWEDPSVSREDNPGYGCSRLWQGEFWRLPKEYELREVKGFLSLVAESIHLSDYINIEII